MKMKMVTWSIFKTGNKVFCSSPNMPCDGKLVTVISKDENLVTVDFEGQQFKVFTSELSYTKED